MRILTWIKCFFGKHEWIESASQFEGEQHRQCIHCHKIEHMYMGDWVPIIEVEKEK